MKLMILLRRSQQDKIKELENKVLPKKKRSNSQKQKIQRKLSQLSLKNLIKK